ncbi:hypothetical protein NNC19_15665 [Clostridium sp. SHJSY1]|uniref:hypothetical protein n=1 Tax=Clostridium sp. SHJSY1 TaxID=2942483 RepID=UPI002875E7F5|nr:hypothetical protein [Clostridium sp. SHJSY1]MDS0527129.1 hypothetical protein [Clostridium sp. SHJSY1]
MTKFYIIKNNHLVNAFVNNKYIVRHDLEFVSIVESADIPKVPYAFNKGFNTIEELIKTVNEQPVETAY